MPNPDKIGPIGIFLRGLAMGAADVVPGVSGGTIAFITGIYARLLAAIASFNLELLRVFRKGGVVAAWRHVDGAFLVSLLAGIICALVLFARLLTSALDEYPLIVWSFFFGLVAASVYHMARQIPSFTFNRILLFLVGAAFAYAISIAKPVAAPTAHWFIFVAASISICATILPGISGSFILLLVGVYPVVLEAIGYGDYEVIAYFAAGAIFGLLTFVKVVSWMFSKYEVETLSVLTGFLLGSLNTLWPWKVVTQSTIKPDGTIVALAQDRVLPATWEAATGSESMWILCLAAMAFGVLLVLVLELFGKQNNE